MSDIGFPYKQTFPYSSSQLRFFLAASEKIQRYEQYRNLSRNLSLFLAMSQKEERYGRYRNISKNKSLYLAKSQKEQRYGRYRNNIQPNYFLFFQLRLSLATPEKMQRYERYRNISRNQVLFQQNLKNRSDMGDIEISYKQTFPYSLSLWFSLQLLK